MRKDLLYIRTIEKTGELQRAAEELFISPPALSKYIANLEKKYGVTLLERKDKRWQATQIGRKYLAIVEQIDKLENLLATEMSEATLEQQYTVKINISGGLFMSAISDFLPQVRERYPQVKVELYESRGSEAMDMIRNGQVDVAVVQGMLKDNEFEILSEKRIPMAVVIKADDPIALGAVRKEGFVYPWVDAGELDGKIFFSPIVTGMVINPIMRKYFPKSEKNSNFRTDNTDTVKRGVLTGTGVALRPALSITNEMSDSGMTCVSFGEEQQYTKYSMISRRGYSFTRSEKLVVELLKEFFKNSYIEE